MDLSLSSPQFWLIWFLILIVAALYSSVGHGGASGYLAVLSFTALGKDQISTNSLILNLLVAGIALTQYARAQHMQWQKAWPFMLGSIPFAFYGAVLKLEERVYFIALGFVLLFAALRVAWSPQEESQVQPVRFSSAVGSGGAIGFVSGLVGVGGGIFLSPLLVFCRWATIKQAAATSAAFILVNSLAGLLGRVVRGGLEVGNVWPWLIAGLIGALAGSHLGAWKLQGRGLRLLLALVLLIAGGKMLMEHLLSF